MEANAARQPLLPAPCALPAHGEAPAPCACGRRALLHADAGKAQLPPDRSCGRDDKGQDMQASTLAGAARLCIHPCCETCRPVRDSKSMVPSKLGPCHRVRHSPHTSHARRTSGRPMPRHTMAGRLGASSAMASMARRAMMRRRPAGGGCARSWHSSPLSPVSEGQCDGPSAVGGCCSGGASTTCAPPDALVQHQSMRWQPSDAHPHLKRICILRHFHKPTMWALSYNHRH